MLNAELARRAFLRATQSMSGAAERWNADSKTGLTDEQLSKRLADELGAYGGSSSNGLDVEFTADGLRIWAPDTGFVRRPKDKPILQGRVMLSFARQIYAIANPSNVQLTLF